VWQLVHQLNLLQHVWTVGSEQVHFQNHHLAGCSMRYLQQQIGKMFNSVHLEYCFLIFYISSFFVTLKNSQKFSRPHPQPQQNLTWCFTGFEVMSNFRGKVWKFWTEIFIYGKHYRQIHRPYYCWTNIVSRFLSARLSYLLRPTPPIIQLRNGISAGSDEQNLPVKIRIHITGITKTMRFNKHYRLPWHNAALTENLLPTFHSNSLAPSSWEPKKCIIHWRLVPEFAWTRS